MSKLLSHPEALLNTVQRIAVAAGEITLEHYNEAGYEGADIKDDGSPVTLADREAEAYIMHHLKEIAPEIPVVGEESYHLLGDIDLRSAEYFWLVDPLDGTREFVAGGEEYTVNIALIHKGEPILGVIVAPVIGEVYLAHRDLGAARWLEETDTLKGIRTRDVPARGNIVIVSKSRGSGGAMDDLLGNFKVDKKISRASSLKICAVACGKADIYPNVGATCEWDLAAGHAIIRAAGGDIYDMNGNVITYGHKERGFVNPPFIAAREFPLPTDEPTADHPAPAV